MPYATDPICTLRRRIAVTGLIGACAVVSLVVWAARMPPASPTPDGHLHIDTPAADDSHQGEPIIDTDPALFAVKLWNPPPPPPPREQPQQRVVEREPPLNLQLIGILHEGAERRAVIYDPQTDQLFVLGPRTAERIQQHQITVVTDTYVELTNGRSVRRLELVQWAREGGQG